MPKNRDHCVFVSNALLDEIIKVWTYEDKKEPIVYQHNSKLCTFSQMAELDQNKNEPYPKTTLKTNKANAKADLYNRVPIVYREYINSVDTPVAVLHYILLVLLCLVLNVDSILECNNIYTDGIPPEQKDKYSSTHNRCFDRCLIDRMTKYCSLDQVLTAGKMELMFLEFYLQ